MGAAYAFAVTFSFLAISAPPPAPPTPEGAFRLFQKQQSERVGIQQRRVARLQIVDPQPGLVLALTGKAGDVNGLYRYTGPRHFGTPRHSKFQNDEPTICLHCARNKKAS